LAVRLTMRLQPVKEVLQQRGVPTEFAMMTSSHTIVPSSSLTPDSPNLWWPCAKTSSIVGTGMNQFVPTFPASENPTSQAETDLRFGHGDGSPPARGVEAMVVNPFRVNRFELVTILFAAQQSKPVLVIDEQVLPILIATEVGGVEGIAIAEVP
jgi:hypothetical protein